MDSNWRVIWKRFRRNRLAIVGMVIVSLLFVAAVLSLFLAPQAAVNEQQLTRALEPPSGAHWFGTDHLGRDIALRVLYGSRISLSVGFGVVGIAMTIGTILGLLAGYFGGWWDDIISRVVDIMLAFPMLLLAIAVAATLGHSLVNLVLAIAFATFPTYARLVRSSVLVLREETYVEAARVIGVGRIAIMFRHILPNLAGSLLVFGMMRVSTAILAEASLSYLGIGIDPKDATWGSMLSDGREYLLIYEWLPLFPGLAILFTVMGFNFLGDGLRDLLDPKMKNL